MVAVKSRALVLLVLGVVVPSARGDSMRSGTWQWQSWSFGVDGTATMTITTTTTSSTPPPAAALTPPAQPATPSNPPAAPQLASPPPSQPLPQTTVTVSSYPAAPAAATAPAPSPNVDAFLNFGSGPFANANTLTTGGAQSWANSPQVAALFGGTPSASQQSAFVNAVVQRVQQTFQQSGVPVTLTTDPNAAAAHTLSVVSNTVNPNLTNAIGMTYLGGNGFDFIDNAAKLAGSVDQLEWIVAHNIGHELMLAFGVGENYDQSGNYIDARNANLSMMLDPNATFSAAASQALLGQNFLSTGVLAPTPGAQIVGPPAAVPEPGTIALFGLGGLGLVARTRRRRA